MPDATVTVIMRISSHAGLHKIDIEGLWQALYESRPADSLAGQIVELTEFCQRSLAEFELSEKITHKYE